MSRSKVTSIPGAYAFEGKVYGPFEATGDVPFVEVPTLAAHALNLPLYVDPDAPEPEPVDERLGRVNPQLVAANTRIAELEAELVDANTELARANAEAEILQAERANLIGAAETNAAQYSKHLDISNGLGAELEAAKAYIAALENAPALVILPEDAHARLVALKGIGDTLADQIMAALTEPATS